MTVRATSRSARQIGRGRDVQTGESHSYVGCWPLALDPMSATAAADEPILAASIDACRR